MLLRYSLSRTLRPPLSRLFPYSHRLDADIARRRTMATKTVAVLDESELKDGEMKQVAFEDGQVLVSRIGDEIHATSAFCTHYGAPLAKGVLTSDGRVVW